MRIVDSQVSRTLMPLATTEEKTALTWVYSCPDVQFMDNQAVICNTTENRFTGVDDSIETPEPTVALFAGLSFEAAVETCPQAALKRFSRLLALDEILSRLRTEKGQDTFNQRFRGMPQGLTLEEELSWTLSEAEADHDAETMFSEWAHALDQSFNLRRAGKAHAFILPAPPSHARWQSRKLWIEGALADPEVIDSPAIKRMARRHLLVLLHAIASFADGVTGHDLAASHATIARRACQLVLDNPALDPGGRGKPLCQMSDSSVEKNIKVLLSALRSAGWAIERAGGRHLTTVERCLARVLFGITQDRAASVQDLVTPRRAWVREEPRETQPQWATNSNPFVLRLAARDLWKTTVAVASSSPYPLGARFISLLTIYIGLLTKSHAIEKQISPQQRRKTSRFAGVSDPSREAQKITADLRRSWGWLLPKNAAGQRMDARVITRIIDDEGASHLTAKKIKNFVDLRLSMNFWEFSPTRIKNKLAWFRTVLRDFLADPAA